MVLPHPEGPMTAQDSLAGKSKAAMESVWPSPWEKTRSRTWMAGCMGLTGQYQRGRSYRQKSLVATDPNELEPVSTCCERVRKTTQGCVHIDTV